MVMPARVMYVPPAGPLPVIAAGSSLVIPFVKVPDRARVGLLRAARDGHQADEDDPGGCRPGPAAPYCRCRR